MFVDYGTSRQVRLNIGKWFLLACLSAFASTGAVAAEWKTVEDTSLIIRDGSPLDFSKWLPAGPAGSQGSVMTGGPKGRFAFAKNPGVPATLNCVSLAWSPATGSFPDKTMADLFARQIKVHGYNLVRIHHVEAMLMTNRTVDFDFDPVQLDRFYYFLSALKKQGVYWVIDVMTSENGAIGNVLPNRWIEKHDLKVKVHLDDEAKAHWRMLVDKLYVPKNPYTGLSLLNDPAMAGMILLNEGSLNFLTQTREKGIWPAQLQPLFVAFLKRKYANDAALSAAWGDLRSDESLAAGTVRMPEARKYSVRMQDFQRLLGEVEADTGRWMGAHLRMRGYGGPLTSYDNWNTTQASATRAGFGWIDMHAYHDEVFGFSPGTKIAQTSSTETGARYARWLATARHAGKPFSVTEYGQPFWNRFRFEAGAIVPAMAALQGWDYACLHGEGGVDLTFYNNVIRKVAVHPYGVGIDPVTRAGETLAALLFMRGDVSPSPNRIGIDYLGDSAFTRPYLDAVPDDLGMVAWMTGVEVLYPKEKSAVTVKQVWQPTTFNQTTWGLSKSTAQAVMTPQDFATDLRVAELRKLGILDSSNRTNVTAGLYESDTKQLLMDTKNRRFIVTTPRTEAITMAAPSSNLTVKYLTVLSTASPALLSASSLDDLALADSKKILLIFATDAQNTGMTFADTERRELVSLGKIPVQIQRGVATVKLALNHGTLMKLTALTLNGEPGNEIPLTRTGNAWTMTLDSNAVLKGPTTFFLLEKK